MIVVVSVDDRCLLGSVAVKPRVNFWLGNAVTSHKMLANQAVVNERRRPCHETMDEVSRYWK
jgi:hypothetical protein